MIPIPDPLLVSPLHSLVNERVNYRQEWVKVAKKDQRWVAR